MHSYLVPVALALATSVSAQTFKTCILETGEGCIPNPAFGGSAAYDFGTASKLDDLQSFWKVDDGIKYDQKMMSFDGSKAAMVIYKESNAPTIISHDYLLFGKVDVTLQAAPGRGIVTSIVLQSDIADEIDWEFIGSDRNHVQTNFYAQGIKDYTHAKYFEVPYDVTQEAHTYSIEWTADAIIFSIDGRVLRTATPADGSYPQTPMQVRLGTWVGGKGGPEQQGTIDWAGGLAEWDKAPFTAYYQSVKVTDYGAGTKGAKEYVYDGTSGTWQSMKIIGGEKGSVPTLSVPTATSPTASGILPPQATDSTLITTRTSTMVTSTSSVANHTTTTTTSSTATTTTAAPVNTDAPGAASPLAKAPWALLGAAFVAAML